MARAAKQKRAPARVNATERAEVDLKKVEAGTARKLHRYGPVYSSVILGLLATAAALMLRAGITIPAGAIAFFLTYLVTTLSRLRHLSPAYLRTHADESDIPGYVILLVVIATIIASSVSFFVVANSGDHIDRLQLALGVLALLLGWLAMHAMLAFHYAYEYYGTDEASAPDASGNRTHVGGLDFPGKQMPDALSFLYFSFVIAMTAQVSDVTVTSNAMRRLVLLHGIVSFFFNTVIIAVAVNIVVSLGH